MTRTPASINGLLNHSFHQNCLSTLRHRGSVGYGSTSGSTLLGSGLLSRFGLVFNLVVGGAVVSISDLRLRDEKGEEGEGRALRDVRRAFSLFDFAACSCLCCKDLVISISRRVS